MSRSIRVLILGLLVCPSLPADPIVLTVTPVGGVGNLYRWQLLPGLLIQKPGDSVEAVHKAHLALKEVAPDREDLAHLLQEAEKLCRPPLADLDRKRVAALVERCKKPLDLIAEAVRKEQHQWGFITERLRKAGLAAILSEVQEFRDFLSLLHLQARHHLLEDRPEQAVQVAATALSLGRIMGECPTLIAHLVALATTHIACDVLQDCIQHPRCPSLFDPLTELPRPLMPTQRAYDGERLMCHGTMPGAALLLADPLAPLPAETLEQVIRLYRGLRRDFPSDLPDVPVLDRLLLAQAMKERHPQAQKVLRANGYSEAVIAKMPIVNAAILHAILQYEAALGEMTIAATLPFPQAVARMEAIHKRYPPRKYAPTPEDAAFPLVHFLLPNADRILSADLRIQRRLELLRTVEALRQHAATTGKWPETLSDLRGVVLPSDPATLKPFAYQRDGDVAALDAPLMPGDTNKANAIQIRLTLRKPPEKQP